MGRTDTAPLKRTAQNYLLEFDLRTRRQWRMMNVDADGNDGDPPAADPDEEAPLVAAFDGVSAVGTVSGSVEGGGFQAELTIPRFPADFDQYFGVDLMIRTWHSDVPGVVGAAGTDTGRVRVFRGYQQTLASNRVYGKSKSVFPIESSSGFLKRSQFRNGWDWAAATPHGAPGTAHDVVRHILLEHTNWYPRALYGLYFPDHALTSFSFNEGQNLLDALRGVVGTFCLEPWVMCRRGDDLYLGCHPDLDVDDLHPSKDDPIIELDDDLVLEWNIARERETQVASVTIVAQQSDQTQYVKTYPADGGAGAEGSHPKFTIRSDDPAAVDALAERQYYHLNRRWVARPKLPLDVSIDLGDVIEVTTRDPARNYDFRRKKFAATAVAYAPVWDGRKRTFTSDLVLDELAL